MIAKNEKMKLAQSNPPNSLKVLHFLSHFHPYIIQVILLFHFEDPIKK